MCGVYGELAPAGRTRACRLRLAVLLLTLLLPPHSLSQAADSPEARIEEARRAIAEGEYLRAVERLSPIVETAPSPDAYLYLGLAHAHLRGYDRALEVFEEASRRYPDDPRFPSEIAGVHLANRRVGPAVEALDRALEADPDNAYASDLLASIRLSQGDVEEALDIWNRVGRPRVDDIFQNFAPGLLDWSVPRALAFHPGEILTYDQWRTTESRLFASGEFSNVGLEMEPAASEEFYNVIVRTTARPNNLQTLLGGIARGILIESVFFDYWDIGNSGISWNSNYRWDASRRRAQAQVRIPLPFPGLPVLELENLWRSEDWDLGPSIREAFAPEAQFQYQSNGVGFELHAIPHYRLEIDAGFEYRNREARGSIAALAMDGRNSGTFNAGAIVRLLDGQYKNQIRLDGFAARRSVVGDFDFSGGTAQFANRFAFDERSANVFDWSVTAGTSRGNLPVDHYFVLGLYDFADHRLRAHVAADDDRYGRAPMGTDFILLNTDFEHRLRTIPLFNAFGLPYIDVRAIVFYDAAKTFDRNRIFRQDDVFHDAGAGLRFETPTVSFTVLYGRDITGGENALYGYVERRFW